MKMTRITRMRWAWEEVEGVRSVVMVMVTEMMVGEEKVVKAVRAVRVVMLQEDLGPVQKGMYLHVQPFRFSGIHA
jgi:hypothetical protein